MSEDRIDFVVIGGGSAGLVASHGAGGLGAEVVMVEPNHPGGDCLWKGCVPSKRLLTAAKAAHTMRTADKHGITAVEPEIDFAAVMGQFKAAQDHIAPHDSVERLEESGVRVIPAYGKFTGPNTIEADGETLHFRKAMIAVGAAPSVPPIPGLREANPLTSDDVWDLAEAPKRLAVIGGGAIGCELGQAFSRLGSTVTLFEFAPTLMPFLGSNVGELIAERFRAEGIDVRDNTGVGEVKTNADGTYTLITGEGDNTEEFIVDKILAATGRSANTKDMGLEAAGVELDKRGLVVVNDRLQTSNPHIYAGGDVVGKMPFTHTAGAHGSTIVGNALFKLRRKVNHDQIPFAIFCEPEVASIGQIEAKDGEDDFVVHHIDHHEVDRAITSGDPVGFTELFTSGGTLVGATVVGETAGETINELTLRVTSKAKLRDVGQMIRPYPTHAESSAKAANEVLREQFFSPKVRKVTMPILQLLDRVDNPGDGG